MGLIEAWGTGIRRIKEAAKSYGLPSPEILVYDDMFRVNLYRNKTAERLYDYYTLLEETPPVIGEASEKHRRSIGETSEKHRRQFRTDLNDTQIKILELLSADASLSAAKMAGQLGIAGRNVEANIKKLKEKGILIRHGSPKSGYWEIVNDKKS